MRLRSGVCVVMLLGLLSAAVQSAAAQSPEELFNRGNTAYEQGRYERQFDGCLFELFAKHD